MKELEKEQSKINRSNKAKINNDNDLYSDEGTHIQGKEKLIQLLDYLIPRPKATDLAKNMSQRLKELLKNAEKQHEQNSSFATSGR